MAVEEDQYLWTPCAAEPQPDSAASSAAAAAGIVGWKGDDQIALPIVFEYMRSDSWLRPASLDHAAVDQTTARRLAALAVPPPLLHLAHHVVMQEDHVVNFASAKRGAAHPNCPVPIVENSRDSPGWDAVGQPHGWGVMIDTHVPSHTVIGEYLGDMHNPSDRCEGVVLSLVIVFVFVLGFITETALMICFLDCFSLF